MNQMAVNPNPGQSVKCVLESVQVFTLRTVSILIKSTNKTYFFAGFLPNSLFIKLSRH